MPPPLIVSPAEMSSDGVTSARKAAVDALFPLRLKSTFVGSTFNMKKKHVLTTIVLM